MPERLPDCAPAACAATFSQRRPESRPEELGPCRAGELDSAEHTFALEPREKTNIAIAMYHCRYAGRWRTRVSVPQRPTKCRPDSGPYRTAFPRRHDTADLMQPHLVLRGTLTCGCHQPNVSAAFCADFERGENGSRLAARLLGVDRDVRQGTRDGAQTAHVRALPIHVGELDTARNSLGVDVLEQRDDR